MRTKVEIRKAAMECGNEVFRSSACGQIDIDPHGKQLTASLEDIDGTTVFTKRLDARPSRDRRWD